LLLLANVTGSMVSGCLARRDMAFPFLVSSLSSFLNAVLVACLVEEKKRRAAIEQPLFFKPIKEGLKHYVQHRSLVILTLGSAFISIGVSCYFLGWQPYLQQFGAGPEVLGITYAIMSIGFSLGSFGGGKFAKRFNNKSGVIVGSLIGLGVFCLLLVRSTMFIIIFLLVLWESGFGFHEPGRYAWLNEFIPSDIRATLLSLNRLLLVGGNTLGTLLAGFAAEFNLQLVFIMGAIAFLSSVSLFCTL
ncbi:MAG: MFS transporter, partial [Promethearchaeota archaeon]